MFLSPRMVSIQSKISSFSEGGTDTSGRSREENSLSKLGISSKKLSTCFRFLCVDIFSSLSKVAGTESLRFRSLEEVLADDGPVQRVLTGIEKGCCIILIVVDSSR